jgi:hypothetical protein
MHPDQELFLASRRNETFRDEADRDRLLANARQHAVNPICWNADSCAPGSKTPPAMQRRRRPAGCCGLTTVRTAELP